MNLPKDRNIPMVSVVMITYNHEEFIREAIEGILMQVVNFQMELIIADDCSPDKTQSIVQNIQEHHANGHCIQYTRHSENKGLMPNFVWALEQAKGKYIALCEGDDYWTDPLKLQKQVDFLESNQEYVITYHNAIIIDESGKKISDSKLPDLRKKDFTEQELKETKFILTLTMVFRNCIKNYPSNFLTVYNADMVLISLLGNYGKGKYLEKIKAASYRQHSGGVWSRENDISRRFKSLNTSLELLKYYKKKKDKHLEEYFHQKLTVSLNNLSTKPLPSLLKNKVTKFIFKNLSQIGIRNGQYYLRNILLK